MSFYVIDVGAKSLRSLFQGVLQAIGEVENISVVFAESADKYLFEDVPWRMDRLIQAMSQGQVATALISPRDGKQASAVIYPENQCGTEAGFFLASIDLRASADEVSDLFEAFYRTTDILFFCSSAIDSIILDLDPIPTLITTQNFPWNHWDLVEAAVRRSDGSWEHRSGHRKRKSRGASQTQ